MRAICKTGAAALIAVVMAGGAVADPLIKWEAASKLIPNEIKVGNVSTSSGGFAAAIGGLAFFYVANCFLRHAKLPYACARG